MVGTNITKYIIMNLVTTVYTFRFSAYRSNLGINNNFLELLYLCFGMSESTLTYGSKRVRDVQFVKIQLAIIVIAFTLNTKE